MEPAGVFEFHPIGYGLAARRYGGEADHQGTGEGPGLRGMVAHLGYYNAGLLEDFPDDRALQ